MSIQVAGLFHEIEQRQSKKGPDFPAVTAVANALSNWEHGVQRLRPHKCTEHCECEQKAYHISAQPILQRAKFIAC
jgi:hypothetical protein